MRSEMELLFASCHHRPPLIPRIRQDGTVASHRDRHLTISSNGLDVIFRMGNRCEERFDPSCSDAQSLGPHRHQHLPKLLTAFAFLADHTDLAITLSEEDPDEMSVLRDGPLYLGRYRTARRQCPEPEGQEALTFR